MEKMGLSLKLPFTSSSEGTVSLTPKTLSRSYQNSGYVLSVLLWNKFFYSKRKYHSLSVMIMSGTLNPNTAKLIAILWSL